jgi:hypothetical protein
MDGLLHLRLCTVYGDYCIFNNDAICAIASLSRLKSLDLDNIDLSGSLESLTRLTQGQRATRQPADCAQRRDADRPGALVGDVHDVALGVRRFS